MGKKIKSTVKFRLKKSNKKKDTTWLARDKNQLFSLENGVKKLSLSTPFGEK